MFASETLGLKTLGNIKVDKVLRKINVMKFAL